MTEVLVFWSADSYEKIIIEGDVPASIYISNKSNNGIIEKVDLDAIIVDNQAQGTRKAYYIISRFTTHSVDSRDDIYPAIERVNLKPFSTN